MIFIVKVISKLVVNLQGRGTVQGQIHESTRLVLITQNITVANLIGRNCNVMTDELTGQNRDIVGKHVICINRGH